MKTPGCCISTDNSGCTWTISTRSSAITHEQHGTGKSTGAQRLELRLGRHQLRQPVRVRRGCGNNVGSRTNLSILRFDKAQLSSGAGYVQVDTIRFSYADQTDFTPAIDNTRFDCEAFVVVDDTLHLFSKDWVTKRTRRYKLPAQPGTYSIAPVDSLEANGLITSAARSADGAIVLLGYDNVIPAPCFLWLLFDYPGTDFFAGTNVASRWAAR